MAIPSYSQSSSSRQAFTLIELSIVLVIIGLLVGGVILGKDMIEVAKARSIMAELSGIETAVKTFRVKYNCFPGDCAQGASFGFGYSGNGNSILRSSGVSTPMTTCANDADINTYAGTSCVAPTSGTAGEPQAFWAHLSGAKLIAEDITYASAAPFTLAGSFKPFAANGGSTYLFAFSWGGKTYIHTGLSSLNSTFTHTGFPTASLKGAQVLNIMNKLNYAIIPNPGCTGYGTCTYPPALSQGQRVIATTIWSTIPQAIYWPPNLANSTYTACVKTVGGVDMYDSGGDCHLLWQID